MSEPQADDADLKALAESLAALVPVPGALKRDEIVFRAGRVSATRRTWLWTAGAGLLGCAAAFAAGNFLPRPEALHAERIVYVRVEVPVPAPAIAGTPAPREVVAIDAPMRTDASAASGYLALRDQVIRWGADSLPASSLDATAARRLTVEELLGLPPRKLEQPGLFRKGLSFQAGESS